jgi:hypothetical protein
VSDITINGIDVTTLFVPYNGANANIDLNNKSMSGVNSLTATSVVASGTVQGQNLTSTALTTTNTLKINSVPAGTVAKALAVDAAGNVIEGSAIPTQINVTALSGAFTSPAYFTYITTNAAGAQTVFIDTITPLYYRPINATLYLKNISTSDITASWYNLGSIYGATTTCDTLSASQSVSTQSITATGTTTTNSLVINSVPVSAGVGKRNLAVTTIGGYVVEADVTKQIDLTDIGAYAGAMYFTYIQTNAAGVQTIYIDTSSPMYYNASSNTLFATNLTASGSTVVNTLKINSVPAGTAVTQLAIDATGNVVQGGSSIPTQIGVNGATSGAFYPALFSSQTVGNQSIYVETGLVETLVYYPATRTLDVDKITTNSITLVGTAGTPVFALGIDSSSRVITFTPSQPTVTGTQTNADFYPMFASSPITTPNSDLYVDLGGHLTYNPSTNLLTTTNLTVSGTTTIVGYAPLNSPAFTGIPTAPTATAGTNTTQIATTQFVTSAGYAPINSPNFTGIPSGPTASVGTSNFQLANTSFVATSFAPLASPIFTGSPNAPTQSAGNNSTLLATTAFVQTAIGGYLPLTGGTMTGTIGIDAGNLGFLLTQNDKNVAYSYTIGSNGTSGANTWITLRSPASMIGVSPLVTITPPMVCSSTLNVGSTLDVTGITTANAGLSVNSGGVNYANIGFFGASNITGDLTVFSTGGTPVFYMSQNGITGQILASKQYNWLIGGATVMNITSNNVGLQMGSMFDFSVGSAGGWDNSNSLYITTGGLGGNNSGVGMGFNTTLDSGLLCCIAPNVAWKTMTYKALGHSFRILNTSVAGVNNTGLYADNAGYLTSYQQANTSGVGLTGGSTGDLVLYANSSTVLRIYAGTTQVSAFFTYGGAPAQLWKGTPVWYIEAGGVNIYMNATQSGYWDNFASGWRMNAVGQLTLGSDTNYVNIKHKQLTNILPSAWDGGVLFTNTYQSSSTASGLNIGSYDAAYSYGFIVSLRPSIVWNDLYLNAANTYVYVNGTLAVYSVAGGWISVSDEREKTDIKPLKTNRSLERVLAAKTYTYKRKFYLDSSGNDLVPQEDKDKFHIGIMAQQIKDSNPHCLSTWEDENTKQEERLGINYNDYVIHLLGAVQEQQKQITAQQSTIDLLTKHLSDLTNQVNELTKKLI